MAQSRLSGLLDYLRSPLIRSGYALILSSAATSVLGFVFWVVAARSFTSAEVGLAVAAIAATDLIANLGNLGWKSGLMRFAGETGIGARRLIRTAYGTAGAAATVGGVIFLIGQPWWTPDLSELRDGWAPGVVFVAACLGWVLFQLEDSALIGTPAGRLGACRERRLLSSSNRSLGAICCSRDKPRGFLRMGGGRFPDRRHRELPPGPPAPTVRSEPGHDRFPFCDPLRRGRLVGHHRRFRDRNADTAGCPGDRGSPGCGLLLPCLHHDPDGQGCQLERRRRLGRPRLGRPNRDPRERGQGGANCLRYLDADGCSAGHRRAVVTLHLRQRVLRRRNGAATADGAVSHPQCHIGDLQRSSSQRENVRRASSP